MLPIFNFTEQFAALFALLPIQSRSLSQVFIPLCLNFLATFPLIADSCLVYEYKVFTAMFTTRATPSGEGV